MSVRQIAINRHLSGFTWRIKIIMIALKHCKSDGRLVNTSELCCESHADRFLREFALICSGLAVGVCRSTCGDVCLRVNLLKQWGYEGVKACTCNNDATDHNKSADQARRLRAVLQIKLFRIRLACQVCCYCCFAPAGGLVRLIDFPRSLSRFSPICVR